LAPWKRIQVGMAPVVPPRRERNEQLFAEPVLEDRIVVFVPPDDPLLRRAPMAPLTLCGRQFVMREPGSATRALVERCPRETSCGPGHVIELGSRGDLMLTRVEEAFLSLVPRS
jgi:DNA-binding transcriptional LysR family regulator